MNRYNGPPSKALPTTLCQKCLKKGHYSYECKAGIQDRGYVSRPSRTQQLQNPKLLPKLTSDVPNELLRKKGIADELLAKSALERGRQRTRAESVESRSSSTSVSTISTNMSASPSPPPKKAQRSTNTKPDAQTHHRPSRNQSRKRSYSSASSADSLDQERLNDDRNTRRRRASRSPEARGRRRSRSRSHQSYATDRDEDRNARKKRRELPSARAPNHDRAHITSGASNVESGRRQGGEAPRHRSKSPFSRRLALTQAMNL